MFIQGFKLGYKDSNLEMTESESVALPFGDSPLTFCRCSVSYLSDKMYYIVSLLKMQVLFLNFFNFFKFSFFALCHKTFFNCDHALITGINLTHTAGNLFFQIFLFFLVIRKWYQHIKNQIDTFFSPYHPKIMERRFRIQIFNNFFKSFFCLLYTSPSPRD